MIEQIEAYLYGKCLPDQVIVGSGLIAGLEKTQPFSDFITLSWPYYGSCAAIEVIALSKRIPRVLLVEINFIFKGTETELTNNIFGTQLWHKKFMLPFLQHRYQPWKLLKKLKRNLKKALDPAVRRPVMDLSSLEFFRNAYDVIPSPDCFKDNVLALKKNVDAFSLRGCQVIFFEMPMESSLTHARLFSFQRAQLKTVFGSAATKWIALDESQEYQTTDGLHLTCESFLHYAQYLSDQFNLITS